jgi:hypothetical protein
MFRGNDRLVLPARKPEMKRTGRAGYFSAAGAAWGARRAAKSARQRARRASGGAFRVRMIFP